MEPEQIEIINAKVVKAWYGWHPDDDYRCVCLEYEDKYGNTFMYYPLEIMGKILDILDTPTLDTKEEYFVRLKISKPHIHYADVGHWQKEIWLKDLIKRID